MVQIFRLKYVDLFEATEYTIKTKTLLGDSYGFFVAGKLVKVINTHKRFNGEEYPVKIFSSREIRHFSIVGNEFMKK